MSTKFGGVRKGPISDNSLLCFFRVSSFDRFGGMYRVIALPNGLTVASAEMPHMTSVSVGIWIGIREMRTLRRIWLQENYLCANFLRGSQRLDEGIAWLDGNKDRAVVAIFILRKRRTA